MMFENTNFTFGNIAYTAIGAAVFWGKWGRTELKAYVLSDLIGLLPIKKRSIRAGVEFLTFVGVGVVVGVGLTEPVNPAQAIMAGLGWTGLFAHTSSGR